jgi:hypothetical protein
MDNTNDSKQLEVCELCEGRQIVPIFQPRYDVKRDESYRVLLGWLDCNACKDGWAKNKTASDHPP